MQFPIGIDAQKPFNGNTSMAKTFDIYMRGLWFKNDGANDITIQINSDTFTVKAGEVFDEFLPSFIQITITNVSGSAFRGYVRG